ncbi:hypothetical protein BDN72DRAFT_904310 [Pluteus cervinus]|uniref:Uncharacterized protein n=1 Tax=Pluteus cervinus TaxID=181527 RepID=A0ACD3A6C5_9AGAR|nr:hypothetical protein BDN72DRAFT_904310 [Pluteus cervinus]
MNALEPHILKAILGAISGPDLIRLASTNTWSRDLVTGYMTENFSIEELLKPFIDPLHTTAFRKLQQELGVVISGSQAVQFFDRRRYEGSDLDLYAHSTVSQRLEDWLTTVGYTRAKVIKRAAVKGTQKVDRVEGLYDGPVFSVATFHQRLSDHTVQVISTQNTVMEVILAFPITCVMNVITHDEAISFYPIATFDRREALVNKMSFSHNRDAFFNKYQKRGWTITDTVDPTRRSDERSDFYCPPNSTRTRYVGDKHCWTITLPPLAYSNKTVDYKFVNSWRLTFRNGPMTNFTILRHKKLTHSYVVALDMELLAKIDELLRETSWVHLTFPEILIIDVVS